MNGAVRLVDQNHWIDSGKTPEKEKPCRVKKSKRQTLAMLGTGVQLMENREDHFDKMATALDEIQALQEESERQYHNEADDWWNSLSKEQQLAAFYSVTKRMHHGLVQGVSYRSILYGLFGFDKNAYGVGMASGFQEIYNHCDLESVKDSNQSGE